MVIELASCVPDIKVNSKTRGSKIVGKVRYENPGTMSSGPFFLANDTLCDIDIVVSDRQQKLEWEKLTSLRVVPKVVKPSVPKK